MASSIDIIVKVIDEASKKLQDISKSTDQLGKDGKSTSKSLAGLGKAAGATTAVLATMAVVASKAFEMGKSGAAVKQTGESFTFLMEKVGASNKTLEKLRSAARGTVDDMTLMSSTATLLAGSSGVLGERLAESTPLLLNIAKAAQKLNPSLGDTTFLYNSLAVGIKRGSPLILDNLGLLVSQGDANKRLAAELGKTVAALTTEEMKLALLNETIRAGNVLVNQAGGNTESATDAYDRLGASWKNLKDIGVLVVHDALEPAVKTAADLVEIAVKAADAHSYEQQALHILANEYISFGTEQKGVADKGALLKLLWKTQQRRIKELGVHLKETAALTEDYGGKVSTATGQIEDMGVAMGGLFLNSNRLRNIEIDLLVTMGESTREIENKKDKIKDLTAQLYNEALASERSAEDTKFLTNRIASQHVELEKLEVDFENVGIAIQAWNDDVIAGRIEANKMYIGFLDLADSIIEVTRAAMTASEIDKAWSKEQNKLAIAQGDTTLAIVDQTERVEQLRREVELSRFEDEDKINQWHDAQGVLAGLTDEFDKNTRAQHSNTRSTQENADATARNNAIKDTYRLLTGRATDATLAMETQIDSATEAFLLHGVASGYSASQIAQWQIELDGANSKLNKIRTTTNLNTQSQIAYNNAIAGSGAGAGGFTGSVSGDVAGGLGLKSMDVMRSELGVASGTGFWNEASERDVMAEYYKLTQQAAGLEPDWDAFYDQINEDRAERGEDPITVKDVSPIDKAKKLREELESMEGGHGSIYSVNPETGKEEIKDWMAPLFGAIEGFQGFQHGANFTVPAGFNNDGFMMGVSSGEHVKVTPSHMNSGSGGLMINNLNVYGVQTASELYETIIQQARMRGKDFAKVL